MITGEIGSDAGAPHPIKPNRTMTSDNISELPPNITVLAGSGLTRLAIPALKTMRTRYGDALFSQYGFLDAFNPTFTDAGAAKFGHVVGTMGWFDTDYLGIDQGPILGMIENYRSELVWKYMKKSPYIRKGLQRAGFTGGWLQ